MINHNLKTIFLHPAKCGGASIRKVMFDRDMDPHISAAGHVKLVGKETWDTYFTFGFCRNPFDRVVSFYCFRQQLRKDKRFADLTFDKFINTIDRYKNLPEYRLQSTYFYYKNNPIDFIGRFENYQEDFQKVNNKLGTDFPLIHKKKTQRTHYSDYYNKQNINTIRNLYKEDLDNFNYDF